MKESELFEPIKKYFEENGWTGDGEVEGIDLYLEKDGLSTAVELKKTLDFKAVQQAALDQKTCDFVYIGIFSPRDLYSRSGKDKLYLLKRLGIGLLCVSPRSGKVEPVNDPVVSELSNFQKHHRDKAQAIKTELRNRRVKNNTGGVNKTKLMTAYREESLLVLKSLCSLGGRGTCRQLRELTGNLKSTNILYMNYYGWFENISKGVYGVTDAGLKALDEYKDTIEKL